MSCREPVGDFPLLVALPVALVLLLPQEAAAQSVACLLGSVLNVSCGPGSTAGGLAATALGASSNANGDGSLAAGVQSAANGLNGTAIGANSTASGIYALAVGQSSVAAANGATAIGQGAVSNILNGTAVGQGATAAALNGTAIGQGAHVLGNNSVAIGTGSIASSSNIVSVGSVNNERRITNVAAGISTTDAVNMGQFNSAIGGLQTNINQVATTAYGGIAAAAALQNNAPYVPGRWSANVGTATFKDQVGVGGNVSYWTPDGKINFNAGVALSAADRAPIARAGMSFVLD